MNTRQTPFFTVLASFCRQNRAQSLSAHSSETVWQGAQFFRKFFWRKKTNRTKKKTPPIVQRDKNTVRFGIVIVVIFGNIILL